MKNFTSYDVVIKEYDGNFIAATTESPHLYFVGTSLEEVKNKITSVVTFYNVQQVPK